MSVSVDTIGILHRFWPFMTSSQMMEPDYQHINTLIGRIDLVDNITAAKSSSVNAERPDHDIKNHPRLVSDQSECQSVGSTAKELHIRKIGTAVEMSRFRLADRLVAVNSCNKPMSRASSKRPAAAARLTPRPVRPGKTRKKKIVMRHVRLAANG